MRHDSCTFIFDFMEKYPITFSYNVTFLPPIILSVSWIQQSAAVACTVYTSCSVLGFYHILHADVHLHVICRENMCCMLFCPASCCSSHQLLPGTVFLVLWKVFGNLLCVFWVLFSDSHLKLAELKPKASNSSSTPCALQSLFLCFQLEMKALCFFLYFPLWPPFSFLSGIQPQSSDPQTGWRISQQHEGANKAVREVAEQGPRKLSGRNWQRENMMGMWWKEKTQNSMLASTWITHSFDNKL